MKKLLKPNVLERTPEQRGIKEKHSPWTAPRDKKKKRSTYDHSLPDVDECNQSHQLGIALSIEKEGPCSQASLANGLLLRVFPIPSMR